MEDVVARNTQLSAVPCEGHAGVCPAPAVAAAVSTSAGATATAKAEGSVLLAHPGESSHVAELAAGQVLPLPSMDGVHHNLDQDALPHRRCTRSTPANKQVLAKAEDAKHLFATEVTGGVCLDSESVSGSLDDSCSGCGVRRANAGEDGSPEAVTAKRKWLDGFVEVLSLDEVTVLKWPVHMVCYTATQPSVSYCCNPLHFDFRAGSSTIRGGSPVRRSLAATGTAGDLEDVVSRVVEGLLVAVENANKPAELSCSAAASSDLGPTEAEAMVHCNGSKLSSKTDALFSCKAKIGSGRRRRQYRWKKKDATELNDGKVGGKNPGDHGETEGYASNEAEESAAKHGVKDKQKKRKKKKKKEKKHKKRRRSVSSAKSAELAAIACAADNCGSLLLPAVADLSAAGQPSHSVTPGAAANGTLGSINRKHRKRKGHKRKAKDAHPEKRPRLELLDGSEPGTCSHASAPAVAAVTPASVEHAVNRDTCSSAAGPALQPPVADAVKSAHVKGDTSCSEDPATGSSSNSCSSKGGVGKLAETGSAHRPLSGDGTRKKCGGQVVVAMPLATTASHAGGSTVPPLAATSAAQATALVAPTTVVASQVAASSSTSTTVALPAGAAATVQGSTLPARGRKLSEGQTTSSSSCGVGAQPNGSDDVQPKKIKIAFKPVPGCKSSAGDRAILEPTVVSRWDSSSSDSEGEQRRKATLVAILGESRSSSNGRPGELRPADAAAAAATSTASLSPAAVAATSAALGLHQKQAEPQRSTIHEPSLPSSFATAERERQAARGNRRTAGATGGPINAATGHVVDLPVVAAAVAAEPAMLLLPGILPMPGSSSIGRDRSRSAASSPDRRRRSLTVRDNSRSKSSSRSHRHSDRSSSGRRSRSTGGSSSGGSRRRSSRSSWSSSGSRRSGSGHRRRRRRRRHGRRSSRRRSDESSGASSSRSRSGDSRRSRRSASGRGHRRHRRRHRRSQRTYSSSAERSYSASSSSAERSRSRSRRHEHRTRRRQSYRSGSSSGGSSSVGGGSRRGSASDSSRSRSGRRPSARRRLRSPSRRSSPTAPLSSLLLPPRRTAPGATVAARRAAVSGVPRPGAGLQKLPPHKPAGALTASAAATTQPPAQQRPQAAAARIQAPTAGIASMQQPPQHEQPASSGNGGDSRTGATNQAGTVDATSGGAAEGNVALVSRSPSSATSQAEAGLSAAAHIMTVVDKGDQRPFIGPVRPGDRDDMTTVQNADIPLPMELPATLQLHHGAGGPRQSPPPPAAAAASATVEQPGEQHQTHATSPATPTAMLLPPEQTEMYRGLQEQAELYRELREQQQRMREAAALRQGQATVLAELGAEDVDQQPAPHEAVVQSYAQQIMMTQRTAMFPQPATVSPSPPPMALFGPTAAALHHQAVAAAAAASQVPVQAGLPLQVGSPVVLAGPSPAAAAAAAMHAQIAAMHAHHQKQQQQQQLVAHAQAVAHMQQLQAAATGGLPFHFSGHPGLVPTLGGLPGMPVGAHPLHGIHVNGLGPGPGPGGLTFSQAGMSHLMGPGHPALTPGPQMLQLGPQIVHLPMGAHVAGGGQPLVMIQGSPHILLQRVPRGL